MGLFSSEAIAAISGGIRVPAPKDYRLPDKFPSFSKAKRICFDLESKDKSLAEDTGPGWRRGAFIVGAAISLADAQGNIEFSEYYPLRHKNAPNIDPEKFMDYLRDEFSFYQGEITGANLLYDFDGLQYENVIAPLARFRDVQWAEALIDENAFNYRLDGLGVKYLKQHKAKDELEALYGKGYIERFDEVHPGHARTYGLGDVHMPQGILPLQYKELRHQKLEEVFDLECRLLPMLLYMRRIGQRVDLDKAQQLREVFTAKRAESLREATRALGKRGFELTVENFGKKNVITAALDHLGVAYPRTAPTDDFPEGQPSITDKWLESLDNDFGHHFAAANKYDKALETFVEGYISDFEINGRVHCEFHPLRKVDDESGKKNGTVSGRFSSVHPNLQNIPVRDSEIGPLCRAMFIPDEDMDFFSGDYSQIEYREIVEAAVRRARLPREKATKLWGKNGLEIWEKLQSAFKTQEAYIKDPTTDFHQMMANLTGLERKYAKSVNFAVAFVMGVQSFAETLGWVGPDGKPTQKALDTLETYHGRVPFVKAVGTAMTYEASETGHTTSLLGRRAHYDMWEPRFREDGKRAKALPFDQAVAAYGEKLKRSMTHAALNRFTQMGGGDMMKTSMVKAWEGGLLNDPTELYISLTVHDELDGGVGRAARAKEKLRELQDIMEHAVPLSLPTVTEFKVGPNWKETH